MPATELKNIVVIGGSSAGIASALNWRDDPISSHRMIIVEQKSHYNYVYAFPRASVKPGIERELFVPYANLFYSNKNIGQVVQAKVIAIHPNYIELDRSVEDFGKSIPFTHLIFATGTTIPAPGHFNADSKADGVACLKTYQDLIRQSKKPLIIGGGAVGLELAAEIKDFYPEKDVTLIHSRERYLQVYKSSLHTLTFGLLKNKLGVNQILGDRVVVPKGGFSLEVKPITVRTTKGRTIETDLPITCIGMTPNTNLMAELSPQTLNLHTRFIQVKSTMQIKDDRYPHIYAAGDVIESTDVKTGHFAWYQSLAALHNIRLQINADSELQPYVSKGVAIIKIALGDKKAVMQTNVFGPLITLPSWIVGGSVPDNLYADFPWAWIGLPCDEEHKSL
ncbi:hypothetical protein INT43_000420 [Umbelopsis isabellina]|uniref:FAD/NAD(P)-binding domain-containing protein n=1 Tax=Mortierella isabellina TaxID=91625 RepID=A0A8H7Q2A5_MORIS|nr:hypothetical protein INT43_000420 [Umbelopsis isabellina]